MLGRQQQSADRSLAEGPPHLATWSLRGLQASATQQEPLEASELQFQALAWKSLLAEREPGLNSDWPVGVLLQFHPREPAELRQGLRVREREAVLDDAAVRAYSGKWVVIEGNGVVVANSDPAEAVRLARSRGIQVPYLVFVEVGLENVSRIGL